MFYLGSTVFEWASTVFDWEVLYSTGPILCSMDQY